MSPPPISGHATEAGTAAYRARLAGQTAAEHFRTWEGLALSSVGLGTYLGDDDEATDAFYRAAIVRALELGGNVLDSAINYRHQRSERVIGEALRLLLGREALGREEVVITTKGGFLPFDGAFPANRSAYLVETYIRPGILKPDEIVARCHAMTPRYLTDQLERSRRNLGLDTIDVYYLHNPETQLSEVPRPEFLRRIRAAFETLEAARAAGAIRMYGTATWNGYRQPPEAQDYLSVQELVGVAQEVAGERHHFRLIQLPLNLAMSEAFTLKNQPVDGEPVSLLEAARHFGLYVMASASLYQGQLARRLPPVVGECLGALKTDAQRALQFVRSTPGLGTALVGMKLVAHVEENLAVARVPPAPPESYLRLYQNA
jgi:aryl-alcohol dehydrogenase-like predicted oxidoreductase